MTDIVLHYLNCRGRGQAVRGLLSDAGVAFEDIRYPIDDLAASWPSLAKDRSKTGPFAAVPVLHWDQFRLAQMLPQLSYVDSKLGYHQGKTPEQIARQQMMASAAHLDITMPLALMLWQPIFHPGTDIDKTIETTVSRVAAKLRQLNTLWGTRSDCSGAFWWKAAPSSADFAVFEAWRTARLILQHNLDAVCRDCSELLKLESALCERSAFEHCEAKAPEQQCGSPVEMKLREKIRAAGPTRK